jgi:cell division septation protein DedD
MSRINDALKRAQRAQRQNLSLPGANVPRRLPVQSGPGSAIGWILPGVIGFLIVAACLFIGMALITRTATKAANRPNLVAAQPATSAPAAAPVRAPTPAPAAAPPPLASAQPPPPPPEPKLQGIVYAATGAWAIMDGRTVHVGDRLGDFHVKEISPRIVTLEKADGSQKKLGLDK